MRIDNRLDQHLEVVYKTLYPTILVILVFLLAACGARDNVSAEKRIQRAKVHMQDKAYGNGIIELKNVLQKEPDNSDALFLLGKFYLAIGDGGAAEKELVKARQLGITKADVRFSLVRSLLLQRKYKSALEILEENVVNGKSRSIAHDALLGTVYLRLRQIERAKLLFQSVLERQPDNYQASLGNIDALLMEGKYADASKHAKKFLEAHPDDLQATIRVGESAFVLKNYKASADLYKASLAMKETKIFSPKVFEISAKAANAMLAGGDIKEAITLIDKLISRLPGHPLPQYLRALSAYMEGDNPKAKDHLLNVLKVLPNHAPSLFLLGAVSYGGEKLEMAEMYLSKFVAAAPSHVPGRKLLSATRVKLGQSVEAVDVLLPILEENPQDAQLLLLMGTASVGSGDHKKGIKYLKQAVKKSPGDIAVRNELAAAYIRSNQISKAILELESIRLGPSANYKTNSLLVLSYLKDRKPAKALIVATELVAANSDNPHAYTLLGQTKLVAGNLRQGQEQFNTALAKQPGYLPATMALANILVREKQFQQAKDLYLASLKSNSKNVGLLLSLAQISQKLGETEANLDWLEKARAADKTAIQPRLILARYYMQRDIMWKAREFVSEAAEIAPEHIAVLQIQGIIKLRENSPGEAIKIFSSAAQKYPKRAEPYYLLSRAQLVSGSFKETRTALQKAISINSKFLPARLLMASLEMQLGRYQQGETLVVKIREDFPGLARADNLLGDLYMAHRHFQKAAAAYGAVPGDRQSSNLIVRQAGALFKADKLQQGYDLLEGWLKAHPKDTQVRMTLATGYQTSKRYEESIRQYEEVLKNKIEHPGIYNNLALAYGKVGDKRAVEYAQKAHKLAPKSGAVTDTLGWLLVQSGEVDSGLEKLRLAVRQTPNNPDIRFHFAQALYQSGDKVAARLELGKLLTTAVDFDGELEAQKLLNTMK